ncbi:MAG: methyltransferase domain-containing protein [Anaerolineaceae bacterium]|nr:methyltransferase domain-containing protein [Anaerolineaceae bacterium]
MMKNPIDLYEILACPTCKTSVQKVGTEQLICKTCKTTYPIINGVPVLFPDGIVPSIQHESGLLVRQSYDPWVHRVILQSLLDDQIVLDIGSGNMGVDDPCIIRMDVGLSPFVDVVGDAHYLPFLPETFDYIFSLAVFEHLKNPFLAARSIFETLKNGGYIYHECNFIYAYHGYPHHYFNATLQGMESVFADFKPLCKGIAPYQMPSFALDMVLRSYLHHSQAKQYLHGNIIVEKIQNLLKENLSQFDIYFTEEQALNLSAGTYFSGIKQTTPNATVIPRLIIEEWLQSPDLQKRFPAYENLTTTNNVLLWAKGEGRLKNGAIDEYITSITPFNKRGKEIEQNRRYIYSLDIVEPSFGAIGFSAGNTIAENSKIAEKQIGKSKLLFKRLANLLTRGMIALKHLGLIGFLKKIMSRTR